jgi:hypothetical protein
LMKRGSKRSIMTKFPPPRPAQAMALTLKLKDGDERLLRRLGQAMVLQWEEITPELQDVLLDQAMIVEDREATSEAELHAFVRDVKSVAVPK